MSEDGQTFQAGAVRFERLLPGPIERIWDLLTKTELLPGWYGEGSIEPRLGGEVRLMDGHIRGVVTQWRPPTKLAYSWNVFSAADEVSAYPESYLSIELEPHGEEVLLSLVHLPVLERFERQNAMGWHTFLDLLGAALRGEAAEPRGACMQRSAARYGVDLDKLAR